MSCKSDDKQGICDCFDQIEVENFFLNLDRDSTNSDFSFSDLNEEKWLQRVKKMNYVLYDDTSYNKSDNNNENNKKRWRIELDFTKDLIDLEIFEKCINMAQNSKILCAINSMRLGKPINFTENRMVLHCALRDTKNCLQIDPNIVEQVENVRQKLYKFVHQVHTGQLLSFNGKTFKYVVNIGIGGSDLGSKMVCEALQDYNLKANIPIAKCLFVSNVDSRNFKKVLHQIELERTLFIVASKTFTTRETLMNANLAKRTLLDHYETFGIIERCDLDPNDVSGQRSRVIASHFCAVSTNIEETRRFGINDEMVFKFWDWVGGRFSLWSSIGLPILLYLGIENYEQLSRGANCMDRHFFFTKDLEKNMPLAMALTKLFYINVLKLQTHAILPYDDNLHHLPSFLQQLEMESNGKIAKRNGNRAALGASSVVFGQSGTNGQHAFYQMIHQGLWKVPSTFLVAFNSPLQSTITKQRRTSKQNPWSVSEISSNIVEEHHRCLLANCIAQTEALAFGKKTDDLHRNFDGNRPSNMLRYETLDPFTLGAIIALFEHSTFVAGLCAGINSFDQFGVELGKQLSLVIENDLLMQNKSKNIETKHDPSTNYCLRFNMR